MFDSYLSAASKHQDRQSQVDQVMFFFNKNKAQLIAMLAGDADVPVHITHSVKIKRGDLSFTHKRGRCDKHTVLCCNVT